jgi:aminoglycoside phosphotransferase family enzyme/predicted kinase
MTSAKMEDDRQAEVFALLSDPATHGGGEVKRIDTHAAAVFLAGERAYKVKRAVRFPFLDYSTLEKRKAACEAELAVNRAFAPDLYRRVVAITRGNGRLSLDGAGEPVEWAVEMQRFDENATLDHLADRGQLDPALADPLARIVAAAHAAAPAADTGEWIRSLASYIEQNDAAFRENRDLFDASDAERLTRASRAALERLRPLLLARGQRGLVRRGHGDLHLGNIALIDGKPVPFDAIEFDPRVAAGDVLYDLAFLLMDLVERGLDAIANLVLNRYLGETRRLEDLDALAALPLFLSLRAAIRAMVTAAKLAVSGTDRGATIKAAQTYFGLALRLIAPPAPMLAAIGGLSGTGKSVLARALASALPPPPGAVVLRSDVERKTIFGVGETERLPAAGYAPEVTQRVYAAIAEKARRVTAAGHSAIVDAVFARADERAHIAAMARASGVPFRPLFLTAGLDVRIARVAARTRDASDADAEIARQQQSYDLTGLDWPTIDASGTLEQTLAAVRAALRDAGETSDSADTTAGCIRDAPRA